MKISPPETRAFRRFSGQTSASIRFAENEVAFVFRVEAAIQKGEIGAGKRGPFFREFSGKKGDFGGTAGVGQKDAASETLLSHCLPHPLGGEFFSATCDSRRISELAGAARGGSPPWGGIFWGRFRRRRSASLSLVGETCFLGDAESGGFGFEDFATF